MVQGVGHAHLFTVPHLATPTHTIGIDDASACSATSGVITHVGALVRSSHAMCMAAEMFVSESLVSLRFFILNILEVQEKQALSIDCKGFYKHSGYHQHLRHKI